jgi:acyl dehydratase
MQYFEDLQIGARTDLGSHNFTAEEIKAFAARYDPQPFHLDETAAANSRFKRLCASGWHTAAVCMRLMIGHLRREDDERRARGEPVAELGPSPGFRDLRWPKPVYADDIISYASEIVATRPLNSRPGWGLMTIHNTGTNQQGELVVAFLSSAFVERRSIES